MLVKFQNLKEETKRDVLRCYVYWHHDKTSKSQLDWAVKHAFWITRSGKLDNRFKHCEPSWLAGQEKKS
jgi:hypothetical protein